LLAIPIVKQYSYLLFFAAGIILHSNFITGRSFHMENIVLYRQQMPQSVIDKTWIIYIRLIKKCYWILENHWARANVLNWSVSDNAFHMFRIPVNLQIVWFVQKLQWLKKRNKNTWLSVVYLWSEWKILFVNKVIYDHLSHLITHRNQCITAKCFGYNVLLLDSILAIIMSWNFDTR